MKNDKKDTGPQSAPASDTQAGAAPEKTHVKIIIASNQNGDDEGDVFASDGKGKQFLLKRDVECVVPIGVLHTLRLAVNEVYQTDATGNIIGNRPVPRFNITVLE